MGTQGGGLTLLSRMIRRHPHVVSTAGNSDYWTSADEMQNVFGLFLPRAFSGMRFKAPPHDKFPPPRSWTYATDEMLPQYRGTYEDYQPDLEAAFKKVLLYCSHRFGKKTSPVRFLDKSQSYSVRLGLLYRILKETGPKIVWVSRDPYVSIYRAAIGKAGDIRRLLNKLDFQERLEICTNHYVNTVKSFKNDCEKHQIPHLRIKFEDLLEKPEETLRLVTDFVDLELQEDMLPRKEHRLPMGSRFLDRWFPIKPEINQPYIEKLDSNLIQHVNSKFNHLIEYLGYQRLDS